MRGHRGPGSLEERTPVEMSLPRKGLPRCALADEEQPIRPYSAFARPDLRQVLWENRRPSAGC